MPIQNLTIILYELTTLPALSIVLIRLKMPLKDTPTVQDICCCSNRHCSGTNRAVWSGTSGAVWSGTSGAVWSGCTSLDELPYSCKEYLHAHEYKSHIYHSCIMYNYYVPGNWYGITISYTHSTNGLFLS